MFKDEDIIKKYGNRAVATYYLGRTIYSIGQNLHSRYRTSKVYTVSIDNGDDLYHDVHVWVLKNTSSKTKALTAFTRYEKRIPMVKVMLDENRAQKVNIKGHVIHVSINKNRTMKADSDGWLSREPDSIVFKAESLEGQKAVLELLADISSGRAKRYARLLTLNTSFGDWRSRDINYPRPIESVILKEGQMDRILNDVQSFLSQREDYANRGIPYHRGYLFYGPPGTGKTSLARAIATNFGLDVYYVPLSDIGKDTALLNAINSIDAPAVLLLEDVDVFAASHERNQKENSGLTMSGLLNALDGIGTPDGLITIMTTNHKDKLDEAIFRPGRMDMIEEISDADEYQIYELFKYFYNRPLTSGLKFDSMPVSTVMEIFKVCMNDSNSAERELIALSKGKKYGLLHSI